MDTTFTLGQLLEAVGVLVALWGGYKVISEIVSKINSKHDQVQKWDEYDKQIKEVKQEQCLLTQCMLVVLDGLNQLGADGDVTTTKKMLSDHINNMAHGAAEE